MSRAATAAVAAALALAGCAPDAPLAADPNRTFDPIAFFSGRTTGEGELRIMFADPASLNVVSQGRRNGRGGMVLDQVIREGDKPPRKRRWVARPAGPGRYTGTLTDAAGPVGMTVAGPRATIRYTMRNGLNVEQELALQRDGRTLNNRMRVKRFGITVARLNEVIRKVD